MHGRDTYKAEILALGDSKKDLDSFEKAWEETRRAEAIQTARYQKQQGGYLDIQPELDQHWVDGEETDSSPCIVQPDALDLMTEFLNLKNNQALMLTRIGELTDALRDVRCLLDQRVKKKREKVRCRVVDLPVPNPLPTFPRTLAPDSTKEASAPPLSDNPPQIQLPESTGPTVMEPSGTNMPVETGFGTPLSSAFVTSEPSNQDDFSHVKGPLPLILTPTQICSQASRAVISSHHSPCTRSPRLDADTPGEHLFFRNCVSPAALRTLARPPVNIGSLRNPFLLDNAKYEKLLKMPTPQRFILASMDLVFSNQEMAESNVTGGFVYYQGKPSTKKELCKRKIDAIFRQASYCFGLPEDSLKNDKAIRNAINSKCRNKKVVVAMS